MIKLNEKEIQICDILLEAAQSSSETVRIAGGWVRDKILGKENDDIDIAIQCTSGIEFASKINQVLEMKGYEKHEIGVIMANPEQSKHLETANVRVLGVFIDCVNLRAESYAEDSRIPTIRIG